MNETPTHAQNYRHRDLVGVLILLCGSFLAACALGSSAIAASTATAAPRLGIDLDSFDASKRSIALPKPRALDS